MYVFRNINFTNKRFTPLKITKTSSLCYFKYRYFPKANLHATSRNLFF